MTHPRSCLLSSVVLFGAACIFLISDCGATDYYIDSVAGSDSSNGLSTNTPWASHTKAESTSLAPGDTVYFKRGSSFSGAIEIAESGSAGNPITLTSYGTGNAPRFTNPSESDMNGNCIRVGGDYVIIEKLYFHDTPGDSSWFGWYIMGHIGAVRLKPDADHCIIRNNEFIECPQGIMSAGEYTLITSNYMDRGLNAPALWRSDSSSWGPMGIHINIGNHEVSYNTIKNYGTTDSPWGSDGGAIEIDNGNYHKSNIYIHHNYSEGNAGFIESSWDYDAPQYSQEIYDWRVSFNVCYDGQSWLFMLAPCTGIYFDNNTIARYNSFGRSQNSGARMDVRGGSPVGVASGAHFRNNLFIYTSSPYTGNRAGGALKTANWYYRKDQPDTVYGGDGNQVGSGDPQLVDLGNGNYNLMAGSPLRAQGVNLSSTYTNALDFNGNPFPTSGNWDIGAMQYTGIENLAPTSITTTSAVFNAALTTTATNQAVWVHWGMSNEGDNFTWANSELLGYWTNSAALISYTNASLSNGISYYYTFRATNSIENIWAVPSEMFITHDTPTINATNGAVSGVRAADLYWDLTNDGETPTSITVYWGTVDRVNDTGSWDYSIPVGVTNEGIGSSSTSNSLPELLHNVEYFYRVSASNSVGVSWSETESFYLLNISPTADAGPDQTVVLHLQVTLDGSGSSDSDAYPSGGTVTYSWSLESGPFVTISNATSAKPTFTPTVAGRYVFQLEVNDGEDSDVDTVTITTATANTIPYSESFESYEDGLQLAGTNGWTAAPPEAAVVVTNSYSYAGELPIAGAHELVLDVNGTIANNFRATESHTNVWIDMMVTFKQWTHLLPPPMSNLQCSVYVNTNNCLYILNHIGTSNAWTKAPDTSIESGAWTRLTVQTDYTPGNKRFRLWLNEIAVTNPSIWFASATTSDHFTSVAVNGEGQIDDMVVADYNPLTTDPNDVDGDGMLDIWETGHGLNTRLNDASLDNDGDGADNYDEYIADTHPTNPASVFMLSILSAGDTNVFWNSSSNRHYSLWHTTNLVDTQSWAPISQMTNLPGTGGIMVYTNPSTDDLKFFRASAILEE